MIDIYISDIHLGNPNLNLNKVKRLLQFISSKSINNLFLVGDILDTWYDHDFLDLLDMYKNFFNELRRSYYRRGIIIYGNHDHEFSKVIKINGFDVHESIKFNGFTVIHGHQFDSSVISNIEKDKFAVKMYYRIQTLFGKQFSLAKNIANSPQLLKIQKRNLLNSIKTNVITGHTHVPGIEIHDNTIYINCGDSLEHSTLVYGETGKYFVLYDYMNNKELEKVFL